MRRLKSVAFLFTMAVMSLSLSGCSYLTNRMYDFTDMFKFGVGATHDGPKADEVGENAPHLHGIPLNFGVYAQASEFINLGAIHHYGHVAEWDGRGFFAGVEESTQLGIGPLQRIHRHQFYESGCENYFKKELGLWTRRMNSEPMRWWGKPAKELEYEHWAYEYHEGVPIMHRGYQHGGLTEVQIAVSEPLFTKLGIMLRAGVDIGELPDFILGWIPIGMQDDGKVKVIDYKKDDLYGDEWVEYETGVLQINEIETPVQVVEPAPAPVEMIEPDDQPRSPVIATDALLKIYFDYDRDNIRSDQVPRMQQNLEYLQANGNIAVQIEGHCDERGTTEYNLNLGERRARAVQSWLLSRGIDAGRMSIISKGEEEPVALGHNEAAWAQNRRAEFNEILR